MRQLIKFAGLVAGLTLIYPLSIAAGEEPAIPWGMDRIDQRARPLDNRYGPSSEGTGVTVYVVGSGIWISHRELEGRASWGYNAIDSDNFDGHGLGTHVVGISQVQSRPAHSSRAQRPYSCRAAR